MAAHHSLTDRWVQQQGNKRSGVGVHSKDLGGQLEGGQQPVQIASWQLRGGGRLASGRGYGEAAE
jgi:hypothetical protein